MSVSFSPRYSDLAIPKKIWKTSENRYLSFKEILNSEVVGYGESAAYEQAGLEVIENTEEEILDVTKEMFMKVFNNGYDYTDDDKKIRDQFRSLYPPSHKCYDTPISEMISIEFLRKNKELIY